MTRIHVAMTDGLALLTEHEDKWQLEEQTFTDQPLCIAIDPFYPERIYCGGLAEGLWVSNTSGQNWEALQTISASQQMVTAVAVSKYRTQENGYATVWIGTGPSAIWYSEDGGTSWIACASLAEFLPAGMAQGQQQGYPHHVRWLEPDAHNPAYIYVALDQGGVLRSLDKGKTWERTGAAGQGKGHTLRTHPLAPGRVYEAASGEKPRFRPRLRLGLPPFQPRIILGQGGYAESNDHGANWQLIEQGLEHNHYLWSLAVDPGNPEIIIASAAIGPVQAHEIQLCSSIILRRAQGQDWQPVTTGLPKPQGTLISILGTNATEPGIFYAVNNHGVFRSGDTGLTWHQLEVAWPDAYRYQHVQSMAII